MQIKPSAFVVTKKMRVSFAAGIKAPWGGKKQLGTWARESSLPCHGATGLSDWLRRSHSWTLLWYVLDISGDVASPLMWPLLCCVHPVSVTAPYPIHLPLGIFRPVQSRTLPLTVTTADTWENILRKNINLYLLKFQQSARQRCSLTLSP